MSDKFEDAARVIHDWGGTVNQCGLSPIDGDEKVVHAELRKILIAAGPDKRKAIREGGKYLRETCEYSPVDANP
jgi:hypothetical protein